MHVVSQLKSLGIRALLGVTILLAVIAIFYAMGRQFMVGSPIAVVFLAFVLPFLVAGKEIYFGFGNAAFRRICSYFVAAGCMLVALYVLWNTTG